MCGCTDAYLHVVSWGEDACSRTTARTNGLLYVPFGRTVHPLFRMYVISVGIISRSRDGNFTI